MGRVITNLKLFHNSNLKLFHNFKMCEIAGIKFQTNIWNAPIPLSYDEMNELLISPDTGAVTYKTRTLYPKQGNPNAWELYDWGSSNHIALHNDGIDDLIVHLTSLNTKKPIFISLYGSFSEMLQMVRKLCHLDLTILIEWNISCPNVNNLIVPTYEDVKILKEIGHFPVGIKINKYLPDLNLLDAVDFIVASNTVDGRGGKCIHQHALDLVKKLVENTDTPVIGCGGIETEKDIDSFISSGAIAVEIGTAILRYKSSGQGLDIFSKLNVKKNYLSILASCNIVQKGDFVLRNGQRSDVYIDMRKLLSFPSEWNKILFYTIQKLNLFKFNHIVGVPIGGIPWASAIASHMGKSLLICREKSKDYGMQKLIEGEFKAGETCVIIEDVVSTGGSILNISKILSSNGLNCILFCIVNRNNIRKLEGALLHCVFNFQDISRPIQPKTIRYSKRFEKLRTIINKKKAQFGSPRGLCLSADLNSDKILDIINTAGPYICLLKIHAEIIPSGIALELLALSLKHNFLILLDRKFGDIGSTMIKQYQYYRLRLPFHFVTAHGISGKESIRELTKLTDVFLVAQMSSESVLSRYYTDRMVSMAEEFGCGIICQEKISDKLITAVPGINLNKSIDGMGQQYKTLEDSSFADIIIVGRGIYEASDIQKEIEKYLSI